MNVYDYAIEKEKSAEQYYRELANKAPVENLKSILKMLAECEVEHYKILKKMKEEDIEDIKFSNDTNLIDVKDVFKNIRRKRDKDIFDTLNIEIQLYKTAMEYEKNSYEFYEEKAKEAKSEKERDILNKIAKEERIHYGTLQNIINFISEID